MDLEESTQQSDLETVTRGGGEETALMKKKKQF